MNPPSRSALPWRAWILSIMAVFVLIVIVGAGAYYYLNQSKETTIVSLGVSPIGIPYTITGTSAPLTLSAFTLPGTEPGTLTSVLHVGTTTYSLRAATDTTELYAQTAHHAPVAMVQLPGAAYGLSYDPASKLLAYGAETVVGTTTAWDVFVLDTRTMKSKNLGSGIRPEILPGGIFVIASEATGIDRISTQNERHSTFLSSDPFAPFAVSGDGTEAALYNASTKSIQYFALASGTPTPAHTVSVPFTPSAMSFIGTKLFLAGQKDAATLEFIYAGDASVLTAPNPQKGAAPQTVTQYHA